MSDRPIIFSAPMVRALLAGEKTQTRRILKPQPPAECSIHYMLGNESWMPPAERSPLRHSWEAWGGPLYDNRPDGHLCGHHDVKMPWTPGDRLYVRENWQALSFGDYLPTKSRTCDIRYAATDPLGDADKAVRGYPWRPCIHMPRWASRLTLLVTDVRVQRLQDISEEDANAEGIAATEFWRDEHPASICFAVLWNSIHGPEAWVANPFVVAISFSVHHANIDALPVAA